MGENLLLGGSGSGNTFLADVGIIGRNCSGMNFFRRFRIGVTLVVSDPDPSSLST